MTFTEYTESLRAFRNYWDIKYTGVVLVMSLTGEYGELLKAIQSKNSEEVEEEFGDVLWSLAKLAEFFEINTSGEFFDWSLRKPAGNNLNHELNNLSIEVCSVSELIKKSIRDLSYNPQESELKPPYKYYIKNMLISIFERLNQLYSSLEMEGTLETAAQKNVVKLKKRE
jgi:NTP pyrophosphatase (non-canonical NTP hydrolase)